MEDTDNSRKARTIRRSSAAAASLPAQLDDGINKQTSMKSELQRMLVETCAACAKSITDRYIFRALEQSWHCNCLVCSVCRGVLGELGPSLFVRGDLVLCRRDYIRLFGSGGQCSGCLRGIASHESVMRARHLVFHPECFNCFRCGRRLCTGDRFYLEDNRPMCESKANDPTVCATPRGGLQSLISDKVTGSVYDNQSVSSGCRYSMATSTMNDSKEDTLPGSSVSTYHLYTRTHDGSSTTPHQQGLQLRLHEALPDTSFSSMVAVHCEDPARIDRRAQVH